MGNNGKIIGKVSATEKNPSTIDYFYFWMDSNNDDLSPFDVIMVENPNNSVTYAIVEEIMSLTRLAISLVTYHQNLVLSQMLSLNKLAIQIDSLLVM